MKKAVIISSVAMSGQPMPMGFETLNPFKKTRAGILKKKLNQVFKEEQLDIKVESDITYGDIEQLKMDGVVFYILTPFASDNVELDLLKDKEHVVLTDDEYNNADISRILRKIKWLDYV